MKKDTLLILSQKMSKDEILAFARSMSPSDYDIMFPFIAEEEKELSANVAYIFLNTNNGCEMWLSGKASSIMKIVQTTPYEKTERLLLSILLKLKFDTINIDVKFLDYCLYNILAKRPCAITVLYIKLAFKLSTAYPELLYELKMILENMDYSNLAPSVACARKNILKKIRNCLNMK